MTRADLEAELRVVSDAITNLYWTYTRTRRGKPPCVVAPELYTRRRQLEATLRRMRMHNTKADAALAGQRSSRPSRHLYAIAGLWTRRVKIGRAADVDDRLRTLRTGSGEELLILAEGQDQGDYEAALHEALKDHRIHGEWFSPTVTAMIVQAAPLTSEWDVRNMRFAEFVKQTIQPARRIQKRSSRR